MSTTVENLEVKITTSGTEETSAIKDLADAVGTLSKAVNDIAPKFDKLSDSTEKIVQQNEDAKDSFSEIDAFCNLVEKSLQVLGITYEVATGKLKEFTGAAQQGGAATAEAIAVTQENTAATQQLTEAVGETAGKLNEITSVMQEASGAAKESAGENEQAKSSFDQLKSGVDTAKIALGILQQAYSATVGETLEYADAVRDLTTATGLSSEEASRLIQVSDDLGVSEDTIKQSLQALLDNGIQPTTENLAKLSDEYNAISDPVERANFAMEKGGKAGLELSKVFEAGGDTIRRMSGEVNDNLIVTSQFAYQARQADIAIDNLNDTVDGAAIAIGKRFTPAVEKAATAADEYISGQLLAIEAADLGAVGWEETSGIYQTAALGLETDAEVVAYFTQQIEMFRAAKEADIAAIENWVDEGERVVAVTDAWNRGLADGADGLDGLESAAGDAVEEVGGLRDRLNDVHLLLAGPVKNENEEYYAKQKDIGAQLADTKAQMDELMQKKHLTPEQRAELDELDTKYGELKTTYENNATAHQEAGRRIILSIFEQKLAVGGWTDEESEFYISLGEKMGLFDADTKRVLQRANDAFKAFAEGDAQRAYLLLSAMYGFPDDKTYKLHVEVSGPNPVAGDVGLPGGTAVPEIGPDDKFNQKVEPGNVGFGARGAPYGPDTLLFNEDPSTRPEVVVANPGGGGYVLTKQDAQRALQGTGMGGGGSSVTVNLTQNISYPMDWEVAARELVERIRLG